MGFRNRIRAPYRAEKSITLDANNTTKSHVLFTVTGSVLIHRIWGEVTTVIGANHTAGHLRTNDQTATIDLSESGTGLTLSGLAVGTMIWRAGVLATALQLDNNAAGAIQDAVSAGNGVFSPFVVTKKTGAVTTIDYRYASTDAPHSGVIKWRADWEPLSGGGFLS